MILLVFRFRGNVSHCFSKSKRESVLLLVIRKDGIRRRLFTQKATHDILSGRLLFRWMRKSEWGTRLRFIGTLHADNPFHMTWYHRARQGKKHIRTSRVSKKRTRCSKRVLKALSQAHSQRQFKSNESETRHIARNEQVVNTSSPLFSHIIHTANGSLGSNRESSQFPKSILFLQKHVHHESFVSKKSVAPSPYSLFVFTTTKTLSVYLSPWSNPPCLVATELLPSGDSKEPQLLCCCIALPQCYGDLPQW